MEYAAGDARSRQRIGRRIYAAIESLGGALDEGGPESKRLAVELQGGLTEMLEAQGLDAHTSAAHHVRATLSRVAALTAPDPAVAGAWDTAARFDAALASTEGDAAVATAATEVLEGAPELVAGLEGLGFDAEGQATAVLAGGGTSAARAKARVGAGRHDGHPGRGTQSQGAGRAVGGCRGALDDRPGRRRGHPPPVPERTRRARPGRPQREGRRRSLARGGAGLTEVLRTVSAPLAERVGTDIARLRAAGARPSSADVERLTSTLKEVQAFTRGEQAVHEVATVDLDAQQDTFRSRLSSRCAADQIERRVAALDVDPEASASRNLALIEQATGSSATSSAPTPGPGPPPGRPGQP